MIGCPISRSLTASCARLEPRSLPSTGITQLQRYYEPLRRPTASGLSLTGVRSVIPDHALGFPVLRTLSLCTCCRHYPGAAAGRTLRSSRPAVSAFPERVVGSACTSTFSRFARRSLALRPAHSRGHQFVARYTEGFSHFVTSMTAPVASGWSESPGGSRTHWKAPPFTAHTPSGHSIRPLVSLDLHQQRDRLVVVRDEDVVALVRCDRARVRPRRVHAPAKRMANL